ncbi:tRNA adenosine(34) deaminase TadA [Pelistega suis]|uniref:tRNA adenosine(34) deaminase TadA n=1 Tax=Pelistega suis TaxID=1631957 RepID=UPI00211C97FA|nr:tRNA adenosine(34) deaminase TadA [Pelistega suis]MCQ9328576.1 tRNA adenosine(34) deaminase TadA [Pelistega suis]
MKSSSALPFSPNRLQHIAYMQEALAQAQFAYDLQEVPVGAVVVSPEGEIIGRGYNRTIIDKDPTAHAEVMALRMAAEHLGNYRLPQCRLYVTLEPCMMCLGAILHARIHQVVFGATDFKTGACGGAAAMHANPLINHQTHMSSGVLATESLELLQKFFKERRKR